ncbi:MAG: hypothetical protein V3V00_10355 [Saprospiraceae bacterium]
MNIIISLHFRFKQFAFICSIFIFSTTFSAAQNFAKHTIEKSFNGSNSVHAIDLDGDGDIDVLGSAFVDKDITWWENDGDQNFTEHIIDGSFVGAKDVFAIDKDGNIDVLSTDHLDDEINWYENDRSENITKHPKIKN